MVLYHQVTHTRASMSRFFISYRRDDTADASARLYERLVLQFGRAYVFKDVDDIPLGMDFRRVLQAEVAKCDAMLVVIGRQWISMTDAAGRRRLENPNDFVRIEIEAALARGIPVVPVLVQNASMPAQSDLPASLAELAFRHGLVVRGDPHFHRDVDLLITRLDSLLASSALARAHVPPTRFPSRLAQLGYEGCVLGNVEVILPPMCEVPEGEFLMGSDPAHDACTNNDNETPQHWVTLTAYRIGRHPVTVAEFACFVRAGHAEPKSGYNELTWRQQCDRTDYPVVNVTWGDAATYVAWLEKLTGLSWRVPTEAEWEKAARWDVAARTSHIYPWGDAFDKACCNTSEGGKNATTPVGTYPAGMSPCGAEDMAGNVWEWTSSLFKPYPYNENDGREAPTLSGTRVLRGGSWLNDARVARAACRNYSRQPPSVLADTFIGFRVVQTVHSL
jgi:formylglycine-generating enzyme required for sulfatase activity